MSNRPYVIRQGDYLTQLAHRLGVDADEIWEHNANQELREARSHHDILRPGDVIQVPEQNTQEHTLRARSTNQFRSQVPRVEVRLVLQDGASQAAANKRFTARGNGFSVEGTTDQNGLATFRVPVTVREVDLELENNTVYRLQVGGLDPIATPSGVDQRLRALGYLHHSVRDPAGPTPGMRKAAIAAFQIANNLTANGRMDDSTQQALSRVYGS